MSLAIQSACEEDTLIYDDDDETRIEAILKELESLDLPSEDGIPLETNWHRIEMNLLIASVHWHWRDRRDYFAGGNMFIYFSLAQVRNKDYRGPDFFVVKDTDGDKNRDSWVVWNEDGQYPDVIVELASASTIGTDLGLKKHLYEHTFRTPEYFCYDPGEKRLYGWRMNKRVYVKILPNDRGWLWSEELGLWIGLWEGEFQRVNSVWLRFYNDDGQLILTRGEAESKRAEAESKRAEAEARRAEAEAQRAETESRRAETESRRADAAEAELERLRALLAKQGS